MSDDETKATPVVEDAPAEKKGRGRPKKPDSEKKTPVKTPGATPGKRGRPKKPESEKKTKPKTPGGKRGRPAKPESEKTPKKPKSPKKAKKVAAPTNKAHPPVAEMVLDAVAALKDRKGCSLSAVKKYIAGNYKVDMERQAIFIRRYVRKALDAGEFTLVKGSSTTGSFKLADPEDKKKAKAKPKGSAKPRGRPKGTPNKGAKKAKPAKKAGTGKGRGRPKGSGKKKAEVKTEDE